MFHPSQHRGDGKRVPSYIWTGYERRTNRTVRPMGIRPNWHLILTVGGSGSFRQPGLEVPLALGDLILFTPDCYQDYGAIDGHEWENYFAHFPPRPQWHAWMRWPAVGQGLHHVHLPEGPVRQGALEAMIRCDRYAHAAFSSFAHELALSALEEALLLGAHQVRYGRSGEVSAGIAAVVQAINADLRQRFTIAGLARLAGLSPSRFAHVFKEEIGESAIAYINRLRIREGARLLEVDALSVKQAAAAVGFQSPFYFSRQFRRFYRMDPTSYRRAASGLPVAGHPPPAPGR